MGSTFKMLLSLKKCPNDQTVHFKVDGGRFDSERTLKMNVEAKYNVTLTFKPSQKLNYLAIQGSKVELERKTEGDDMNATYTTSWSTTGTGANKKGNRQQIPFLLEFEDGVSTKVNLQCKFYPEKETSHCNWGTPLTHMEYDCHIGEGSTYVDITKETYR